MHRSGGADDLTTIGRPDAPASLGEQGPGEMMMWLGANASISSRVTASWRRTAGVSPSSRT
jgi:hypothetical protein